VTRFTDGVLYIDSNSNTGKKCSKNFDERKAASQGEGQIFHGVQMWCETRLRKSHCHAIIDDWAIPFAAYTATTTPNAFHSLGWTSPKIATAHGRFLPPGDMQFIRPTRVSLGILIGLAILHSTSMWPTHRHADHATCDMCSNRPHLMHWVHMMQPNNIIIIVTVMLLLLLY